MRKFLLLFTIFTMWSDLFAEDLVEFDYEADAYHSKLIAFVDLDRDNNVTDALDYAESEILNFRT